MPRQQQPNCGQISGQFKSPSSRSITYCTFKTHLRLERMSCTDKHDHPQTIHQQGRIGANYRKVSLFLCINTSPPHWYSPVSVRSANTFLSSLCPILYQLIPVWLSSSHCDGRVPRQKTSSSLLSDSLRLSPSSLRPCISLLVYKYLISSSSRRAVHRYFQPALYLAERYLEISVRGPGGASHSWNII